MNFLIAAGEYANFSDCVRTQIRRERDARFPELKASRIRDLEAELEDLKRTAATVETYEDRKARTLLDITAKYRARADRLKRDQRYHAAQCNWLEAQSDLKMIYPDKARDELFDLLEELAQNFRP